MFSEYLSYTSGVQGLQMKFLVKEGMQLTFTEEFKRSW